MLDFDKHISGVVDQWLDCFMRNAEKVDGSIPSFAANMKGFRYGNA